MNITNYVEYISACSNLQNWNEHYRKGEPLVSDDSYDIVRKAVQEWEQIHPENKLFSTPTESVGYIAEEEKNGDNKHSSKMYSLENALDVKEAQVWVDKWTKGATKPVLVVGEVKYNGLALRLTYIDGVLTKALTRGDGEYGNDVTPIAEKFVQTVIQTTGIVEITGEVIIRKKDYKNYLDHYANALSAVVGIINTDQQQGVFPYAHLLNFIPYHFKGDDYSHKYHSERLDFLNQLEFKDISYFLSPAEAIFDIFNSIKEARDTVVEYEIDGVVFKINNLEKQEELGYTGHHPLHSFAYKFPPLVKPCVIRDVVFQVGRTGEVTPVAKVTPTTLLGVVVTSVLLMNEERLNDRKIAIGNTYEIYRSGDVIPYLGALLIEKEGAEQVKFPTDCPCCKSPLVKIGAAHFCQNKNYCKDQVVAGIAYAVSREVLNIADLGEKTISMLYDQGTVKRTADLFELEVSEVASLEGYAERSATKLLNNIKASKRVTLSQFIAALGIPDVAKSTARSIAKKIFDPYVLLALTDPNQILALKIDGVGISTATNIAQYFADPKKSKNAFDLLYVLIIEKQEIVKIPVPGVEGKTFVFTGRFSQKKELLANLVLTGGGKVGYAVSGNTDYVVVGEDSGEKQRTAEVLGIEQIDERTFLSFFEPETPDIEVNYKRLPNGLYVGYHVEGNETFELGGSVPLSMETLQDHRPLFMSFDKSHWASESSIKDTQRVYEVHFELPKQKHFVSWKEYHDLLDWDEVSATYIPQPELVKLVEQGFRLFSLEKNDKGEIPESFILNPTKYVRNIIRLV